jgi:hypothetical protein
MVLTIEGRLAAVLPSKPRYGGGNDIIRLKMVVKDGILCSKHKNHSVSIELKTNNIIYGQDIANRLMINQTNVWKVCKTCHFKICTTYPKGVIKKENCFPALTLYSEELNYTLRGGKNLYIMKYSSDGNTATIRMDNKYLPPVPWDFDKFKDLEHLNKRLDTIKLFH